ncbi:54S ribosomal protein L24, mitochondrial [Candida viswanathii]|uniref:54S ribosomal protein L24, mitochondrial n=1 Tax=Candida viswanathii TaxID=5486 RepID=A0A367XMZ8_9ASCO|nr:54S ribosomal protein L24, mitochondrial [Candida viswanathii]
MNFLRGVSLFNIPRVGITQSVRHFSVTSPTLVRRTYDRFYKITKQLTRIDKTDYQPGQERPKYLSVPKEMPKYPKYDYETRFFKRQNRGLFGGAQRKRSKTCSEYFNKNLSARRPNVLKTSLWSETLNRRVRVKITANVIKTIHKEGGLDQYLLKSTPGRIKTMGLKAWQMRYDLLKVQERKERGTVRATEVGKDGKRVNKGTREVKYIHPGGLKFYASRAKMLKKLEYVVQRDSYFPIKPYTFERRYGWWSYEQIVEKLQEHNWDFSDVAER